jgi:hypothetical protein
MAEKNLTVIHGRNNVKRVDHSYIDRGNVKCYRSSKNHLAFSNKIKYTLIS